MPFYSSPIRRIRDCGGVVVEMPGFSVQEHEYDREAVECLDLERKPFQYELDLEPTNEDAQQLRSYQERCGVPGERVELWNLWLGEGQRITVPGIHGQLTWLDVDTLEQLCNPLWRDGIPGSCRMTVTI